MMAQYTAEDIKGQIKPLSENGFVRFWQKIWRWWLGVWYGFSEKHPKGASLIYKIFFFIVFSEGVTIWQYIVMTFLPYAFASMNTGAVGWPGIEVGKTGQQYVIFGDTQGWGYFIAFELAVFTAQCINFPLQRNITYRSHGNPWWQAMWYFIGWVLISVAVNAIWGIMNVYLVYWGWPDAVTGLIKTVLTGGVSMVIFFFIFMVIFPDNNKMAQKSKAKYDKLVAENAPAEQIEAAKAKSELWADKAAKSNAEKDYVQAKTLSNTRALRYFAAVKAQEEAKTEDDKATYAKNVEKAFDEAVAAIETLNEKKAVYDEVMGTAKAQA
jgi:hypothetical protein